MCFYKARKKNSPVTLLSIMFALFALLIGALTFGNERDINAEVVAIRFVFRGACVTYKYKEFKMLSKMSFHTPVKLKE